MSKDDGEVQGADAIVKLNILVVDLNLSMSSLYPTVALSLSLANRLHSVDYLSNLKADLFHPRLQKQINVISMNMKEVDTTTILNSQSSSEFHLHLTNILKVSSKSLCTQAGELISKQKYNLVIASENVCSFIVPICMQLQIPIIRFYLNPVYPTSDLPFRLHSKPSTPFCSSAKVYYKNENIKSIIRPWEEDMASIFSSPLKECGMKEWNSKFFQAISENISHGAIPSMNNVSKVPFPPSEEYPAGCKNVGGIYLKSMYYQTNDSHTHFATFLEGGGTPPVCFYWDDAFIYKSLPFMAELAIAAVKEANVRCVIIKKKGQSYIENVKHNSELFEYCKNNIFEIDNHLNLENILQKSLMVIHFGDASITNLVLRSGAPHIVTPLLEEHVQWSIVLFKKLNISTEPLPFHKLTSTILSKAILNLMKDEALYKRSEGFSQVIQDENGFEKSADFALLFHSKFKWQNSWSTLDKIINGNSIVNNSGRKVIPA